MNVLGLNFGHDAGVAVIRDGRIGVFLVKERHNGAKHALGLDVSLVDRALDACGLTPAEIDAAGITTSQGHGLIFSPAEVFRVSLDRHPDDDRPSPLFEDLRAAGVAVDRRLDEQVLDILYAPDRSPIVDYMRAMYPEYRDRRREDVTWTGFLQNYVDVPELWDRGRTLEQLAVTDFAATRGNERLRLGLHYPVTLHLHGRAIPAYFVQHHAAHAAAGYYMAGVEDALILSHDGGGYRPGYAQNNGMFYYGSGNALYPITPHHLEVGALYDMAGVAVGFDYWGAGKLMGLAAYGEPAFFDRSFVGNHFDMRTGGVEQAYDAWPNHCRAAAAERGYDLSKLADPGHMTDSINADIAASTQRLFEETVLLACETLRQIADRLDIPAANLCLGGGPGLNCPTNSRIAAEGGFGRVFVEPCCDDSGLTVGAALHVYHTVYDRPLTPGGPFAESRPNPYLGVVHGADAVERALSAYAGRIEVRRMDDAPVAAADDLAENRVIAWYEGASEVGPRALGHRSIVADPRDAGNWPRVNRIKGREPWRPLAPAVLDSAAGTWFRGAPHPSPHMLFTAAIHRDGLPAVTHVDGTARLQTVGPEVGGFYRLIERFGAETGVPVVLNTSFNGPGQPIIETPAEAIAFLVDHPGLDVLYLDGVRVVRVP